MAIYKMIYRDEDNKDTHALHVFEAYITAESRTEAQKRFDEHRGPRHIVAGPFGPIDEASVPQNAIWADQL